MKHTIYLLILVAFALNVNAQAPQAISYQAIARNNSGEAITNQNISLRFTIHNLTAGGAILYTETHNLNTNAFGQFTALVGQGVVVTGVFANITWGSGNKFLQVEMDATGGSTYVNMGTQQMLSVPYALYAGSSGSDNTKADKVAGAVNGNFAGLNASGNLIDNGKSPADYLHKTNTTPYTPTLDYHPATKKYVDDKGNAWGITGNTGTNASTNFIGTTDPASLAFKVNGAKAGFIDRLAGNTSLGLLSLNGLTTATNNTAIGADALKMTTTGSTNSAYGALALQQNTIGASNAAFGYSALKTNVAGSNSTAFGYGAMQNTNPASVAFDNDNTAVGMEALRGSLTPANNTGGENTAVGIRSMLENSTGEDNSAFGANALRSNTTGSANAVIGNGALSGNTTGWYNTSVGAVSMAANTTGIKNTAVGFGALYNNVGGIGATAVGMNAMQYANPTTSLIETENVAVGFEALRGSFTPASNTGLANTAIGRGAMLNNADGTSNTAVGRMSLWNNVSGDNNVAIGYALTGNQTGSKNVAIGNSCMYWGYAASNATAIGFNSMYYMNNTNLAFNCTNVAVGYQTLMGSNVPANNTGLSNTAIGYEAIKSITSGSGNTGCGLSALLNNTGGSGNTAVGSASLAANTTGSFNTAVGSQAGNGINDGNLTTSLGYSAGPTVAGLANATAIGANATVTASNSLVLGNNASVGIGCSAPQYKLHVIGDIASSGSIRATTAFVNAAIAACSDVRFKKNIIPLKSALTNVMSINGVSYFWKLEEFPERSFNDERQIGFIAQELEKIYPELVVTDKDGYKSVDYSKITPVLVEAIKELKRENEEMRASFEKELKLIKEQLGMATQVAE